MPRRARGTRRWSPGIALCTIALSCVAPAAAGPPEAPAGEDLQARYVQVIQDFCAQEFYPDAVVEYFAPGALDVDAGGVLLYPGLAHHTSHDNHKLGVINTQQSNPMVVTWARPGVGLPVSEITVHTMGLEALVYRDFAADPAIPPEADWTQDGPLSDIVHRHVVRCGDREVDALLHEAVWSGDAVGKLTQFTVRRRPAGDPPPDPVDAALQATVPAIRACTGDDAPGGFVTVAFQLTPDGTVAGLQPTDEGRDHPALDACVAAELAKIRIQPCDLQQPKPMEYWLSFF